MSTLQERMSLAIKHYESVTGKRFKNTELARFAGVSRANVGLWVNGPTQELEGSNLVKAAEFLGVSKDWLAGQGNKMIATQLDGGGAQLNVLDIEAFKQKYNIPDSEDAVKFVQTSDKPFPIQKDTFPSKLIQRWVWMGISQIWDTMEMLEMGMFQLTQQDQEPMVLKALATQCFQLSVMDGMWFVIQMRNSCRMSLFRYA